MGRRGSLPQGVRRARQLALALLAPLLAACGGEQRPNVLLVSIDTLRADHLEAYGYERETSPALARLAAGGALFLHSYAQSSATVPTHASLFTGRLPFQHGAYHVGLPVRDEERTLAELFSEAGYRTFAGASSVRFRGRTGFEQGFQVFERFDELEKNDRSEAVTDRILAWIAEGGEPWLAFVHYFDPHQPYAPPEPWRSRWHPGLSRPRPEATSDYLHLHDGPHRPVPPEVLDYLRALYDAEIRYLDVQLARLFGALASRADAPGTLVVVTSDHGEEFKEHGGLSHARRLHEELLRVPLIVWWPGRIPEGTRLAAPVQTVDVLPTVLELAGVRAPRGLPGRSRAASLLAGSDADGTPSGPVVGQIRASRWSITDALAGRRLKYVSRDDAPHRLFDLSSDPGETRDLLAEGSDLADALRARAAAIGLGGAPDPEPIAPVSPEIRERLREIGYVDEADSVR